MTPLDRFRRRAPLIGLAVVTALAAVMYGHVFAGEIKGDDLTFHLAEITRMTDCLRAGDFDFWNPSGNAGYASAYYYQALPQLVPAVLATITGTDVLPWFQLCVFVPLVLAPAAAYRALRLMGTPAWAALGGAFAILMSASNNRWGFGADGTFSVGLYTQTWSLAAFPLALAHGVRWIRDGAGLGPATGWSVFVTVCHPFAGIAIGVALVAGAEIVAGRRLARRFAPQIDRVRERIRTGWRSIMEPVHRAMFAAPAEPAPPPEALPRIGALALRLPVLGALLALGAASISLPLLVDYAGFGGFPHRVWDEVGPGFGRFADWITSGDLFDATTTSIRRFPVLTALFPVALVLGRDRALPWLWSGAAAFVLLLGLGPHLPSSGDNLFPMVRFLGPFQVCVGMAIGAGTVSLGLALWRATLRMRPSWVLPAQSVIAALATAAVVSISIPGARVAQWRVVTAAETGVHRDEIRAVTKALAEQPHGRKQARQGTENTFFNLLPYVDARVPALFQMGGAGLQSSPNYDFLFTVKDPAKTAWVYDAPYVAFTTENADQIPEGEVVISTEHFTVRRLPAPGLVSPVAIDDGLPPGRFAARKAAMEWLRSDAALKDRLIAYAGSRGLSLAPRGRVLDYKRQASPGDAPDITAKIVAEAPTSFVVRESWHPRWRGFIDGTEARLRRVTPDFFAIDVPAGDHALAFRFDRPWWAWASWLLMLVAVAIAWQLGWRLGRIAA